MINEIGPILQGEIKRVRFDLSGELDPGVDISQISMTPTLYEGVDANPAGVLVGLPVVSGEGVVHLVQAGAPGSATKIRMLASAADGTRHAVEVVLRSE